MKKILIISTGGTISQTHTEEGMQLVMKKHLLVTRL